MVDFTDILAKVEENRRLVAAVDQRQRMYQQNAELCAEVGRLQRENQQLQDALRECSQEAWDKWLEATTTAAAKRLQRGQP